MYLYRDINRFCIDFLCIVFFSKPSDILHNFHHQ